MLRQISEVARVAAWTYDIETDQFTSLTDSLRAIGVPGEEVESLLREPERLARPRTTRAGPGPRSSTPRRRAPAGTSSIPGGSARERRSGAGRSPRSRWSAESPCGSTARSQDITSLHDLEAKYLQAQKMEAIGLLAGGIAHDFNNLLTVISGLRELVTESVAEDHPCQGDLTQMDQVIQSASSLTQQLLALARRQVVEPVSLSLNDLLEEVRPLLARLLGGGIETECTLGQGLWPVLADRSKLEQVLLNFAVNAKDAMPNGGRLVFRTRNAVFSAPAGHGPRRAAGRRVRRAPGPGHRCGDGCAHHRADLRAVLHHQAARPGHRARTRHLPRRDPAGPGIHRGREHAGPGHHVLSSGFRPRAVVPSRPAPNGATVLLAEDDPIVGHVTARILRRRGYQVLSADSVESAIHLAASHPGRIDLLLCGGKPPRVSCDTAIAALALTRPEHTPAHRVGSRRRRTVYRGGRDGSICASRTPPMSCWRRFPRCLAGLLDRGMTS